VFYRDGSGKELNYKKENIRALKISNDLVTICGLVHGDFS
jgi:hypothetical protein